MNRKTKRKSSTKKTRIHKVFHKYAKDKRLLLYSAFKRLVKQEFHMNYHDSVYKGALHMWGSKEGSKRFFTKDDFSKMFVKKDGFFRFIYI